jgi:hypothetical protein
MILNLTILNGTHAGHSVQVTAGTPRTFGRAAQSDVVLQDVYLSDVHFALYCDEQGARVRDLQSHNGTFVNNAPVADATLSTGDRISAGQTMFEVALTDHALEAPASAASTTGEITAEDLLRGMQSAPHDCARWALHSEEGNYFAVIDCAREPDLITLVNRIGEEFCAFDETREPDDLGETAPFLVSLTPATGGLADVFEETWGRGHAIFLVSPQSLHRGLPAPHLDGDLGRAGAPQLAALLGPRAGSPSTSPASPPRRAPRSSVRSPASSPSRPTPG